ncbi:MAG TPA: sigma-54 dependent transcriptional regulator [Geobacteraceae bacterium]|nr:sigma-54 dependent transcriptional regulator [Geobacteraceae bacterium]
MATQNMALYPILLVDDEPEILRLTKLTLEGEGIHNILTIEDSRQVLPLLARQKVAAVILDLMMPYFSGLELLQAIIAEFPGTPVIVMTALDEVETAVDCLKSGAFDYLLKPVEPNSLVAAVAKAVKMNSLQQEISSLKNYLLSDRLEHADAFKDIITCSKKMRAIFQYAEVIAPSRQSILITGETGTGKELMAHAIHTLSGVSGEFVAINVAGLDDAMFSDTLFGHKKGAFSGADQNRDGLVSRAAKGTLFLDEIGDLSPLSQVKLLRLLQEEEYYPLGSDTLRTSNARIIVATNHDLEQSLTEGKFRKDLYYRLCTYHIHLPPLRERIEDISLLLNHFIAEAAHSFNKAKPVPSPEAAEILASLHFPGNIREFQAMVFDAVARHHTGILSYSHFPTLMGAIPASFGHPPETNLEEPDPLSLLFGKFPTIEEAEDYLIARALKLTRGKTGAAADLLGISRQGLHKKMKPAKTPPTSAD